MEHKSPKLFRCTLSYMWSCMRPCRFNFLSSEAHFSCTTGAGRYGVVADHSHCVLLSKYCVMGPFAVLKFNLTPSPLGGVFRIKMASEATHTVSLMMNKTDQWDEWYDINLVLSGESSHIVKDDSGSSLVGSSTTIMLVFRKHIFSVHLGPSSKWKKCFRPPYQYF